MSTRIEQLKMIEDCEQCDTELSDYEARFIDSVSQYMDKAGFLSIKQQSMLEAIWNRVTEEGKEKRA